jgi:hypothetical protein
MCDMCPSEIIKIVIKKILQILIIKLHIILVPIYLFYFILFFSNHRVFDVVSYEKRKKKKEKRK